MTMRITMLTTVMGEEGSLLTAGTTHTVSDAFGAAMVGQRKATDTDGALRSTGVGPAMFSDSTGSALVRPDGGVVPLGGGLPSLNLISNGDLTSGTTGWAALRSTLSVSSGALLITQTSPFPAAYFPFSTTVGKRYRASYRVVSQPGSSTVRVTAKATALDTGNDRALKDTTASGKYSFDFIAEDAVSNIFFILQVGSGNFQIADVEVHEVSDKVVAVVFDTDLDTDMEDVAALSMACILHKLGRINLKAVTVASSNVYAAPCARAILDSFGMLDVPVGAYRGNDQAATSVYAQQIAAEYGNAGLTRSNFPTAYSILRQVLASASAGSIVFVAVGPLVNVHELMLTGADGASDETGLQLWNSKVQRAYIMGGDYTSGSEYNFQQAPVAANYVFANSTAKISAMGFTIGGNQTINKPSGSNAILARAFTLQNITSRNAWDTSTLIWAAFDSISGFVNAATDGTNTVNSGTGSNTWTATPGNTSYAARSQWTNSAKMSTFINKLLQSVP